MRKLKTFFYFLQEDFADFLYYAFLVAFTTAIVMGVIRLFKGV